MPDRPGAVRAPRALGPPEMRPALTNIIKIKE
jgi:hypothetical protein